MDHGCVGWRPEGLHKGALVGGHEEYMRSQGVVAGRAKVKGTLGGAQEDDNMRV